VLYFQLIVKLYLHSNNKSSSFKPRIYVNQANRNSGRTNSDVNVLTMGADDLEVVTAFPAPKGLAGAKLTGADVLGAVDEKLEALSIPEGIEVLVLVVAGASVGAFAVGLAVVGRVLVGAAVVGAFLAPVGATAVGAFLAPVGAAGVGAFEVGAPAVGVAVGADVGEFFAVAITVMFAFVLEGDSVRSWVGAAVGTAATVFEIR
jgi:hypothetical protein